MKQGILLKRKERLEPLELPAALAPHARPRRFRVCAYFAAHPAGEREKPEYFAQVASLEEIAQKTAEAQRWFAELL